MARGDGQWLYHVSFIDDSHSPMQRRERAFDVIHDLGLRLDRVGSGLGLLIRGGRLGEDVRGHTIVVGGQVLGLLGESAGAGKLTRGWREGILDRKSTRLNS